MLGQLKMESLGRGSKKVLSKSWRLGFHLPCTKMSGHTLQNLSQTLKWAGTLRDREREKMRKSLVLRT